MPDAAERVGGTHPAGRGPLLLRCRQLLAHAGVEPQTDVGILVDDGRVAMVGPWRELAAHTARCATRVLDGLVLPGLVDAHSHLRGLPLGEQAVQDELLESWLLRLRTLTPLPAGDEALVAGTDLVATGVTSVQGVVHTFDAPTVYADQLAQVVDAVGTVGLRADLMVGLTDQAEWAPLDGALADLAEFLHVAHGTEATAFGRLVAAARQRWDGPRLRIGAAPVAPQWCSDDLLAAVAELGTQGVRVHTHLLESPWQRRWADQDPVTRLRRWGLLGSHVSVAHAVWLDSDEMVELAHAGVVPVHCPSSNEGLHVGAAPVRAWLEAGLQPALGLDSHLQDGVLDAFAEMRSALTTAQTLGRPLTAREVLSMATTGGARAVGRSREVGRVAAGFSADLIVVDLSDADAASADVVEALVHDACRSRVSDVFCAGDELVSGGVPRTATDAAAARDRLRRLVADDALARTARQRAARADEQSLMRHLHGLRLHADQGALE